MIGPRAAVTVPFPLCTNEEHLIPETLQGQPGYVDESSALEFFVSSLKLYDIMHDVMFNFYSVNFQQNKCLDGEKYFGSLIEGHASVFEIERRLTEWAHSVPDRLKIACASKPHNGVAKATLQRQAVILHQRQESIAIYIDATDLFP